MRIRGEGWTEFLVTILGVTGKGRYRGGRGRTPAPEYVGVDRRIGRRVLAIASVRPAFGGCPCHVGGRSEALWRCGLGHTCDGNVARPRLAVTATNELFINTYARDDVETYVAARRSAQIGRS